jgi:hypothetical protein
MSCKNRVEQIVPRGQYGLKTIEMACGSTGLDGSPIYCEECQKIYPTLPAYMYEDAGDEDFEPYRWGE